MGAKFAGVTLDWYDDDGATLKQKFPTLEQVPEVIKEANVQPKEKLAHEDFALIMVDQGHVFRKFACVDAGTTAMSVVYFMEHGDKLPEEAQKTAATNLVGFCVKHNVMPPAALTKIAIIDQAVGYLFGQNEGKRMSEAGEERPRGIRPMDVAGDMFVPGYIGYQLGQRGAYDQAQLAKTKKTPAPVKKVASVVDVTGKRAKPIVKVARPTRPEDYALVVDGKPCYPIHNWDMVKKAEAYFHENSIRMNPEHRRQFATKLAQKSFMLGYPLAGDITELGAAGYNTEDHLRDAIDMRKVACAPDSGAREMLDDLFEKRASLHPEVYAEVLRRIDVQTGLDKGWDHIVLDPWASTFGIDKTGAEVIWENGADRVTKDALLNLACNRLNLVVAEFTYDVAKEFKKDPIGIFNSMPEPHKKMLARMAADSESDGESEHGTNEPSEKVASGPVEFR
jgi:hypothetical protein